MPAWRSELVAAHAARGVGNLVVILQKVDELLCLEVPCRTAAPLVLPLVPLSLIEIAPACRRDQFLRRAVVVAVVKLVVPRRRHARGMVKIVIPDGIEPVSPVRLWLHGNGKLQL